MNDITLTILMGVVTLFVAFVLPQIRLRRDIPSLIRIFREARAIGVKNAKTTEELGLKPQRVTPFLFRVGDPMQTALKALKKSKVIQSTEDGKMYLSEEDLLTTKWRGN